MFRARCWLLAAIFFAPLSTTRATDLTLAGRAIDSVGKAIPEAEVLLLPTGEPVTAARLEIEGRVQEAVSRGRTDAHGYFEITAPRAGLFVLRIVAKGFVPVEHQLQPLLESTELPDTQLPQDTGLTVRVTDRDGKAVRGATVRIANPRPRLGPASDGGWKSAPRAGLSGDDGSIRLPYNESEVLIVTASAPGFLLLERRNVRGTATTLRLERGSAKAVEVTDPEGKPIEGALLTIGETSHPLASTDASGRAKLFVAPRGSLKVAVRTADGRSAEGAVFPPSQTKDIPRRFVLDPLLLLGGRVIDADSRKPIANAWVWRAGAPWDAVSTDGSGVYSLRAAPGERIQVTAGASGYVPPEPIETRVEGREPHGPSVALLPAASIEGTVLDPTGAPVRGAKVALEPRRGGGFEIVIRMGASGTSDVVTSSRGRFRIPSVDPSRAYDLRVRASGYASASREIVGLEPRKAVRGIRIELEPGQRITGRVVDGERNPVADAEVSAKLATRGRGPGGLMRLEGGTPALESPSTFSDDLGRFGVGGLKDATYDVSVRRRGFARKALQGVEVKKGPEPLDLGDLVLGPGETLAGFVGDSQGQPIEGVAVNLSEGDAGSMMVSFGPGAEEREPDAMTGPDGWFSLSDLRPGDAVQLAFSRTGYTTHREGGVRVPSPQPLQITLQPASKVSGIVLNPDRKPVPGADVQMMRSRTSGGGGAVFRMMMRSDTAADDSGRFVFEDVEPGTISLSASAPGWREARLDSLEVPKGADVEGVEIPLELGAVVTGRVLAPDGRPAIGAEVRLVRAESEPIRFRGNPTDGDGRYRLEGVEPGQVSIEATHDEYTRAVKDLEARPGVNSLDLILGGGAEVSGSVVDDAGGPIPGASVRLAHRGRAWGGPETTTGADGSFRFSGVGEGEWAIWAGRAGYAPSSGEVGFIVEGQPVRDLRVALSPGGVIAGKITGVEPDRIAQVFVGAIGTRQERFTSGAPDREGSYRLEDLGPDRWTVIASIPNSGEQTRGEVLLEAGTPEARLDLAFGGGLTLSGRAVHGGTPVRGAMLFLQGNDVNHSGSGRTDQDGRFAVKGLEPGTYRVDLRQSETGLSYGETVEVKANREIVLEVPTARVAGTVVDASDRQPLAGVTVTLSPPDSGGGDISFLNERGATTDLNGHFEITDLQDGDWRLATSREGYAAQTRTVGVQSGRGPSDLRIDLEPTEGLTLEFRQASGRVPAEVVVAVLDASGRPITRGSFATGENGRVRLSTVPPGAWEVLASAAGTGTVSLQASAPGPPTVATLPPSCTLRISVPALHGSGVAATATIRGADGRLFRSLAWFSDPVADWRLRGGETEVDSLPPGSWTIEVAAADGRRWEGNASTGPETTATAVLE